MTHANDNRPPEFDARVMAYMPGLRAFAGKRVPREYRDDLVTDTIIYALAHWKNFREDGGMWNWLIWQMRGILKNEATKAAVRKKAVTFVPLDDRMSFSVPARQLEHTALSMALDDMNTREGAVVLRRAMGYSLDEIATDFGVTGERVRQIEAKERGRLQARVA